MALAFRVASLAVPFRVVPFRAVPFPVADLLGVALASPAVPSLGAFQEGRVVASQVAYPQEAFLEEVLVVAFPAVDLLEQPSQVEEPEEVAILLPEEPFLAGPYLVEPYREAAREEAFRAAVHDQEEKLAHQEVVPASFLMANSAVSASCGFKKPLEHA